MAFELPPIVESKINHVLIRPPGTMPGPEWELPYDRSDLRKRARQRIFDALAEGRSMEAAVAIALHELDGGTEGLDDWAADHVFVEALGDDSIRK